MKKLFDRLEDETPPSQGKEIGDAIGVALSETLSEVNKSHETMAKLIAKSIADALNAVESKSITVNQEKSEVKPVVNKWVFKIERDENDLMTTITATAS